MSPPSGPTPTPASTRGAPGGAASDEAAARVQEDLARLEAYREQLSALIREQEILRMSLEAHLRAQGTLEAMEKFGADREILVPVGAETFVSAAPKKTDHVLLGLGRGYVAELPRERALEILGQRRVQLEKGDQSLVLQLRRLEEEAGKVQARLQRAYQAAQQEGPEAAEELPPAATPGARGSSDRGRSAAPRPP